MKERKKVMCYYHNDMDGIASAAIVRTVYPNTVFRKVNYGDCDINKSEASEADLIIIVDFSFNNMQYFMDLPGELCWIDHHKSAKEKNPKIWNSNVDGIRSLNKSGCELTWEWFNKNKETPYAIKLIGDYDMWNFKYPSTRLFGDLMDVFIHGPNHDYWEWLLKAKEPEIIKRINDWDSYDILKLSKEKRVKKSFTSGKDIEWEGYRCRIINTNFDVSEVGDYAAAKDEYDIGITWSMRGNQVIIGLRSVGDKIDVSLIAKKYGGGGHFNASGFETTLPNLVYDYKEDKISSERK